MARARRNRPAPEVDFADFDQARAWFRQQPRQVCVALAARAALRVLPLIGRSSGRDDFLSRLALPVFRAASVAWTVVEYPARLDRLRPAAAAATAATTATTTAASAAVYAAATATAARAAVYAAAAAATAATATATATATAALKADAIAIGAGQSPAAIAGSKLWPEQSPDPIAIAWTQLQNALLGAGDDWDVWVWWYRDRLEGRASLGEAFDLAVAVLPETLWKEPAALNARIKELIAEHTPPEPIPTQGPGPHFALNSELKIALAPPAEIDAEGNNLGRIDNLLPVVRQAASDLAGHINPNSQPEISRFLKDYRDAIAGEPKTIAWGIVFGLGVRLENAVAAARRQIEDRLQPPLEDAAQEALDTVLTLHGPLILATAEGRELTDLADRFRLTRSEQAALRLAAQPVGAALKNANLAEPAVANIIETAIETIGEGRHPERGTAFGLATIKNVATLLVPAAVLGSLHVGVDQVLGGGAAGLAAGAAAAGFAGLTFAEVSRIRIAAHALGQDIAGLVETARDQADLARAQVTARLLLLVPFRDFVTRNEKPLRQIAENSTQLRWALRYIDFVVRMNNRLFF